MKYRLLDAEEYPKLVSLMDDHPLPAPETSAVAVAEDDDGNLVGCLVLQLQWHMEPLVLTSPKVNFVRLKAVLDKQLEPHAGVRYYSFAESEVVAKMAERAGMQLKRAIVFEGGHS